MPLLDIATLQSSPQSNIHIFWSQAILSSKFLYRNEKPFGFPWKSFPFPGKANHFNLAKGRLVIKAVATLEPTRLIQSSKEFSLRVDVDSGSSTVLGVEQLSSCEGSTEPNERERLRRMRISWANKGNTPWNKGKKHSPETLRLIRERTRLAMQDPKVKMKLVNLGHAQSEETRMKIGVGVRLGWEKRREKLFLQETCLHEWENLIAEASRRGVRGEEELQWDSYEILDKQLVQEWVQSVAERKRTPRLKGSKRAPKSLEQRRKISEAISAKWADPAYRDRVCSGLAKYHGITEVVERKSRRKTDGDGETRKRNPSKRKVDSDDFADPENMRRIPRERKSRAAPYKDPLASSKLEMLKNIRAQRAAIEIKNTEAIARAKLLIAEAEKAANALELAAKKSPIAQASLIETRSFIAKAIETISSIDAGQEELRNDGSISLSSPESHTELGTSTEFDKPNQTFERKVNGAYTFGSSNPANLDFSFEKYAFHDSLGVSRKSNNDIIGFNFDTSVAQQDSADGPDLVQASSFCGHGAANGSAPTLLNNDVKPAIIKDLFGDSRLNGSQELDHNPLPNGMETQTRKEEKPGKSTKVSKKWVRGRLVEVDEGT